MKNKRKAEGGDGADQAHRKKASPPVSSPAPKAGGIFDGLDIKDEEFSAAVESLSSMGEYILRLSVSPVMMEEIEDDNDTETGAQRAVVVVVRFQKSFSGADCWCIKPNFVIDAIRATRVVYPNIKWSEPYVNTLREYPLREVSHGPNVALTRTTRNGGQFETRVLAGFVPVNEYKATVAGIGEQLSDYFRSDVFKRAYLMVVKDSMKESNMSLRGEGMYGIIKNDNYFVWGALRDHRLVIEYDVPLDTFFLDNAIEEMLEWMFPHREDMKDPAVMAIGYGGEASDRCEKMQGGG